MFYSIYAKDDDSYVHTFNDPDDALAELRTWLIQDGKRFNDPAVYVIECHVDGDKYADSGR
jgi:hypothetical protein